MLRHQSIINSIFSLQINCNYPCVAKSYGS